MLWVLIFVTEYCQYILTFDLFEFFSSLIVKDVVRDTLFVCNAVSCFKAPPPQKKIYNWCSLEQWHSEFRYLLIKLYYHQSLDQVLKFIYSGSVRMNKKKNNTVITTQNIIVYNNINYKKMRTIVQISWSILVYWI